jgi:hypothetical protein
MRIGIGLPNTLGIVEITWPHGRSGPDRGFAYLATIDRIVYPTFDSLTSLAVAGRRRIGLLTNILLGPPTRRWRPRRARASHRCPAAG